MKTTNAIRPPELAIWSEAELLRCLPDGTCRLSDGRLARQAASCLLRPAEGDTVLLLQSASGLFITAVLQRTSQPLAHVAVPGAQTLVLAQDSIELLAQERLGLRCVGDVELSSATGAVAISARHLLATVSESLVQSARHLVTRVEHCLLQASALLHLQSGQGLITVQEDLKVDAERISLG